MTLEQVMGAALMLLFLADIFLTALYARADTGLLAPRWNRLVWLSLRSVSGLFGRRLGAVLSFGGGPDRRLADRLLGTRTDG